MPIPQSQTPRLQCQTPRGSPDPAEDVPVDDSPRSRFLLSFVRLVTSSIRHNGTHLLSELKFRLPVCHTLHLLTIQPVFVELASRLLGTGKALLSEAVRLLLEYPDWEVVIDSVKMVEEIMTGPLGYALLSTILQVSWGYAALKASKAALSSLDHMASLVGSHLYVLYPSVKGWEGTEARTRWAGRGATGNPP